MSFPRFIMRLPTPHPKQGSRFVLPPMLLTSPKANENGANLSGKPDSSSPNPHVHPTITSRAEYMQPGRPVSRGGVGTEGGVGRSCSHRTIEVVSSLPEGGDGEVRKPMFTEHILCAKNLTHIILFNPHKNPVR